MNNSRAKPAIFAKRNLSAGQNFCGISTNSSRFAKEIFRYKTRILLQIPQIIFRIEWKQNCQISNFKFSRTTEALRQDSA